MTDDFNGDWREYMRGIEIGNVVPTLEHLQAICRIARKDHGALVKALEKLRSYNVDIAAGRINYRPHDHIRVIDKAFAVVSRGEQS